MGRSHFFFLLMWAPVVHENHLCQHWSHSASGRVLLVGGCSNQTSPGFKFGDLFHFGVGWEPTKLIRWNQPCTGVTVSHLHFFLLHPPGYLDLESRPWTHWKRLLAGNKLFWKDSDALPTTAPGSWGAGTCSSPPGSFCRGFEPQPSHKLSQLHWKRTLTLFSKLRAGSRGELELQSPV